MFQTWIFPLLNANVDTQLMKIVSIVLILTIVAVGYYIFASLTARKPPIGLVDGKLRPCPRKQNCVKSEEEIKNFVAPFRTPGLSWQEIRNAVQQTGGEIKQHEQNYLFAEYKSAVFRFVDDLEIRFDEETETYHVRSGSRSGTKDFGVNRKRVEEIRQVLSQTRP